MTQSRVELSDFNILSLLKSPNLPRKDIKFRGDLMDFPHVRPSSANYFDRKTESARMYEMKTMKSAFIRELSPQKVKRDSRMMEMDGPFTSSAQSDRAHIF